MATQAEGTYYDKHNKPNFFITILKKFMHKIIKKKVDPQRFAKYESAISKIVRAVKINSPVGERVWQRIAASAMLSLEMEDCKMKKRICLMALIVSAAILLPTYVCEAKDVWVDHWNSENVDIYVMDDTLTSGTSDSGRYFKVSAKEVRNGELVRIVHWNFSKYKSDMWRYKTNTMRGDHTTVVIPKDQLFEFCMDSLGWSYYIKEYWYY